MNNRDVLSPSADTFEMKSSSVLPMASFFFGQIPFSHLSERKSRSSLLNATKGFKQHVLMPATISAAPEALISCALILKVEV